MSQPLALDAKHPPTSSSTNPLSSIDFTSAAGHYREGCRCSVRAVGSAAPATPLLQMPTNRFSKNTISDPKISKLNTKKIILIRGGPHRPTQVRLRRKSRHFSRENCALRGCGDLNPQPHPRAKPPLPLHHTLTCV
jgi:hypothetical protein